MDKTKGRNLALFASLAVALLLAVAITGCSSKSYSLTKTLRLPANGVIPSNLKSMKIGRTEYKMTTLPLLTIYAAAFGAQMGTMKVTTQFTLR